MIYLSKLKQDIKDDRDFTFKANAFNLPEKVDLRAYSREVEDQGRLGSCTANASVSSIENLLLRCGIDTDISRLFIYYTSKQLSPDTADKDEGCYSRDVFKALMTNGACTEYVYPYNQDLVNVRPSDLVYAKAAESVRLLKYERIVRTEPKFYKQMKAALAKGYPVYIGMKVRTPFFRVVGDIQTHTGFYTANNYQQAKIEGGHAMCIVGYDDALGYWIVENSWGVEWGDNGFGAIPYGLVDVDILDIWVMTEFVYGPDKQNITPAELWTEPEPVEFTGVESNTDTYYVYRKSPTEQVSYSQPVKFWANGGVAPYTYTSNAIFFRWLDSDTSTPVLSYDWTANPFRPNGGDFTEESAITSHMVTDSSFENQTKQKHLKLVAVDFHQVETLPAEYDTATKVLKVPAISIVDSTNLVDVEATVKGYEIVTAEDASVTTRINLANCANPLAITLEFPKILVDGVLFNKVKVTGVAFTSIKHGGSNDA